ncbi:MAG: FAD-dependent oxidoreductase [Xylophilus ampelinus]
MSEPRVPAGSPRGLRVAVVGGGWAGLAAAVAACRAGHRVVVLEAARTLGGRARTVAVPQAGGPELALDNGQHVLIGAYAETLALMRQVGVAPETALLRLPLALVFPDGGGLRMPDLPAPWNILLGVAAARGWSWADRWSLLRTAFGWQQRRFACPPETTVRQLCAGLRPRPMDELIDPLCVSALNTPADRASGAVFLRVLRDALLGPRGSADLLVPRADLGALLPEPAAAWLQARGAQVRTGRRVAALAEGPDGCWRVDGEIFDRVVLACPPGEAQRLLDGLLHPAGPPGRLGRSVGPAAEGGGRLAEAAGSYAGTSWRTAVRHWMEIASRLRFEAIATVYLRPSAGPAQQEPADRGDAAQEALASPPGAATDAARDGDRAGHPGRAPPADADAAAGPRAGPDGAADDPFRQDAAAVAAGARAADDAGAPSAPAVPDGEGPPDRAGTGGAAAGASATEPDRAAAGASGPADPPDALDADGAVRPALRLPLPVMALRATHDAPAQFVFDRGQLGGPDGLLAFVVSASAGEREWIAARVLRQAADQLGPDAAGLEEVRTVVEKRATFACTPGLARPGLRIAPGLLACGDYVDGPYPATLEGAVRSGRQAAALL